MLALSAFAWTVLVAMLPLPAEGPAIANALLFDPYSAVALTWSGCVVGAVMSFEIARRGGRPIAERWLSSAHVARLDRIATGAGWLGLLGLRLIPAASFTGINWAAGFSAIDRRTFYWTTAAGILPGCIAFTWLARSGATLLPETALPALGALLVGFVLLRWTARSRQLRDRIASMPPLALRFRAASVAALVLAGGLALAAPEIPRVERTIADAHCKAGNPPEGTRVCCRHDIGTRGGHKAI